jgi:nitrite reductase/ring-hydroxylating ferredoxin subunit
MLSIVTVFYATDDTCTHEDTSLPTASLRGGLVKCPLHGDFELTPPYTIRGGVVQQAGKRRSQRKHYR